MTQSHLPPDSRVFAVILAGGSGTRLWPVSRTHLPKHLLNLHFEDSLLQQTMRRVLTRVPAGNVFTVTHERHRFEVRDHLQSVHPTLAENVLAEPESRNTLPAISWAVAEIAKRRPDALIGVFPSDHWIGNLPAFGEDLDLAFLTAAEDYLVTLGIRPTGPETGYGYIQIKSPLNGGEVFTVGAFREKPDAATAAEYLKNGGVYWNSGLFFFSASRFLTELKAAEPAMFEAVHEIVRTSPPKDLKTLYGRMKNISIDYGLMERTQRAAVVAARFDWSDLGSWESLYRQGNKDEWQNVVEGHVLNVDTSSSLLVSKKGFLATIGLNDMVVVQTDDAVLVSPRDRVQEVKEIVGKLKAVKSDLADNHTTVNRPWGRYTVLEEGPGYKIKRILVNSGQRLSLQSHRQRAEHWVVVRGTARVTNGERVTTLKENESTFIPKGEKHRLENPGDAPLVIIEVQTGSYLGEDDIERFDDLYGRIGPS